MMLHFCIQGLASWPIASSSAAAGGHFWVSRNLCRTAAAPGAVVVIGHESAHTSDLYIELMSKILQLLTTNYLEVLRTDWMYLERLRCCTCKA